MGSTYPEPLGWAFPTEIHHMLEARTHSLGTMFLLVSVVYRPWHLGLSIIGPHGHLEKTGECHSLGTLLLEKDVKSLKGP